MMSEDRNLLVAAIDAERRENTRLTKLLAEAGGTLPPTDWAAAAAQRELRELRAELDELRRVNAALARKLEALKPGIVLAGGGWRSRRGSTPASSGNAAVDEGKAPIQIKSGREKTIQGDDIAAAVVLYGYAPAFGQPSRDPHTSAAHAVLRVCDVSYDVAVCDGPSISPTGELPILRRLPGVSDRLVTGISRIEAYAARDSTADSALTTEDRLRMRTYIDLILVRCAPAAEFELWCEPKSFSVVAMELFGRQIHPWPLDIILCRKVSASALIV